MPETNQNGESSNPNQVSAEALAKINKRIQQLSLATALNESDEVVKHNFAFWKTQPVPQLGKSKFL